MNNEIKINVPEGMEIDKENSTFECIKFKPKWIPKRGDIATIKGSFPQIILIAECIRPLTTGFDIKPLALLSENGLSICTKDSFITTLWVKEEACASEKELFIEKLNEQGYIYDPNDPRVLYKKEKELPKTWEEFRKNNPIKPNEYFVSTSSSITRGLCLRVSKERIEDADDNLLPSEEYAKAMLALCKLIQLRDCYNDGWEPNWKEASFKYVIKFFYDECIYKDCSLRDRNLLAFKTEELRDTFYNNFKDLIKEAKLLL